MNFKEALARVPADALNPESLAQLLQAVTAVQGSADRWREHLKYLAQLQGLIESAPANTEAFYKVKRAQWLAIRAATTWAKRNGKPYSFDAVTATVAEYRAAHPAVFVST